MKNLILKRGDIVKALSNAHGMVKGQRYAVVARQGGLVALVDTVAVPLVDALGTCLDACLDVARSTCPLPLPQGQGATLTGQGIESSDVDRSGRGQ